MPARLKAGCTAINSRAIVYRYRVAPDPGYEYLSPVVSDITGYSPKQFYDNPDLDLHFFHPDDVERLPQLQQAASGSLRLIARNENIMRLDFVNLPVLDGGGNLVAVEGLGRIVDETQGAVFMAAPVLEAARYLALSDRERQVLRLVANGLTDGRIAVLLGISRRTTEHHVAHVLAKLGVPNRAAAVAIGYQLGFLPHSLDD